MKLLVVDGLNLIRRIYAGTPSDHSDQPQDRIKKINQATSSSLQRALNIHQPSHCLVVLEKRAKTWRHQLLPDYKKNRPSIPEDFEHVLELIKQSLKDKGIGSLEIANYEADDIIATIATKIAAAKGHIVILSTDRLLCQLINDHISVYDHFNQKFLDHEVVKRKFQVDPNLIPDVLGLCGDSTQSIAGVQSVGVKTAAKLIQQYGNLENVLDHLEGIPGKLGEKIKMEKASAQMAKQLFTLKKDISLGINLNQFRVQISHS